MPSALLEAVERRGSAPDVEAAEDGEIERRVVEASQGVEMDRARC